jgi:hypothetical protein
MNAPMRRSPKAVVGHMPFEGHRTVAEVLNSQRPPMNYLRPALYTSPTPKPMRVWCDQCQAQVDPMMALACASPFCSRRDP